MKMSERDRRDWSLLIFIVPIGILLMLIAGQFGMRIIPFWTLNTEMRSNLNVETAGGRQSVIPLFNIGILTPFAWQNTYLTPNSENGFVFPAFIVLEPSATPSPTAVPATETAAPPEETPTPTETPPPTTSTTPVATGTPSTPPPDEGTDPAPTDTPTATASPTDTPTATASPTDTPTAAPTGIISTVPATYTQVDPPPSGIGVGTLPNNVDHGLIFDGTYIVVRLGVIVEATPDENYDLAFYEFNNGGVVYLDWIIIGISNDSSGAGYYEVFNWGNGTPDANSNIGDIAGTEDDNQAIPVAGNTETPPSENELYDPDYVSGPPETNGPLPQTGILIDVDNAPSSPPPDTYNYVVIISPRDDDVGGAGGSGEPTTIDAIQTVEVPIPPPPPPTP